MLVPSHAVTSRLSIGSGVRVRFANPVGTDSLAVMSP